MPPSVVAVVMVLQRLEGLSDREAVDRYCFDAHRRYAAGGGHPIGNPLVWLLTVLQKAPRSRGGVFAPLQEGCR